MNSNLRACRAALALPPGLLVIRSNPPGERINTFKGIVVKAPMVDKTARTHYSRDGVTALCGLTPARTVVVERARKASCRACPKVLDAQSDRTVRKRKAAAACAV